jgi:glycosyltransferase involved in cell wall biosynthesis
MDISVAIPTYNGAQRLHQVLAHLQAQIETEGIAWEVIVVDNNSTDQTAAVTKQYQQTWIAPCPLRYVFEPLQGLAFARQRAVETAQGDFIAFLDDDNWPAPDWVIQAMKFGQSHPRVGAYGGKTKGRFEVPPGEDVVKVQRFLAIRDYGDKARLFNPETLQLPAGAGLVVRKQAWQQAVPRRLVRVGNGGDDYEISIRMYQQGWEIWYAPNLRIEHFIPATRLERLYLRRLTHQYGLCTCDLLLLNATRSQHPLLLAKVLFGSLKRIIKHLIRHRLSSRKALEDDCMLSFHIGNFKSPFLYIMQHLRTRSI